MFCFKHRLTASIGQPSGIQYQNRLGFHLNALRQSGHTHRRTRRERLREIFGHHFIEHGKIAQIRQISIQLDHIVQRTAGSLRHGTQILKT